MATLELPGNVSIADATPENIAHALAQPRDDDWYLGLARDEEHFIDVMIEDGAPWVECQDGDDFLQVKSHLDEAKVAEILTVYAAGGDDWRHVALWLPPPPKTEGATRQTPPKPLVVGFIAWGVMLAGTMMFGPKALGIMVFALAFPGLIAIAAYTKLQQIKRAESWSKASGRVLRSELVTRTVNGQDAKVPEVEYEYSVGMDFNKVRGKRISFAEIEGPHGADQTLAKYRVGSSPTVYYNPANPSESVLERDFPPQLFTATWAFVAVLVLLILGAGYWWGIR